jgi:copper homeostasis protein
MSKIEVIVLNEEDAKIAEAYGADRLELVSAISEGGLTPSYGTIKRVTNSVDIPVMVMIRPHSFSFVYRKEEWEVIKEDIKVVRELGAAGIVFGALTEEKSVDFELLSMVVEEARGLSITFHRAIDESNPIKQYHALCRSPQKIDRVLTSGGKPTVSEGLDMLHNLVKDSMNGTEKPVILPGSGLTINNIELIHQRLQAEEYHFGSGLRKERDFRQSIDGELLQKIKSIVSIK